MSQIRRYISQLHLAPELDDFVAGIGYKFLAGPVKLKSAHSGRAGLDIQIRTLKNTSGGAVK